MQLSHILGTAALASAVSAVTVSFDPGFDDKSRSLSTVSCSDGPHGLLPRWKTQGDIPNFPYIGGAQAIARWSDPNCGTCWRLEYNGESINLLAIDHAGQGFNIAQAAMDKLTHNRAVEVGRIDVKATQVDAKLCGV